MGKQESQIFPYEVTINLPDDENVIISVEYPDEGTTTGHTFINIPGDNDKEIFNAGTADIGKAAPLKKPPPTIITSTPVNLEPHIENIRENIYINDKLIVEHNQPKSISKDQQLLVLIHFV